jgi:hypothetical protein
MKLKLTVEGLIIGRTIERALDLRGGVVVRVCVVRGVGGLLIVLGAVYIVEGAVVGRGVLSSLKEWHGSGVQARSTGTASQGKAFIQRLHQCPNQDIMLTGKRQGSTESNTHVATLQRMLISEWQLHSSHLRVLK